MNRLIAYDEKQKRYSHNFTTDGFDTMFQKVCAKLYVFEQLEEELGCPLDVVFKAIEYGIVIIGDINQYGAMTLWLDNKPLEALVGEKYSFEEPRLIKYNEWCFDVHSGSYSGCVALKDYKKTWWLKENLE